MTKRGSLGVYMFLRNGDFYDYPWREALLSALPVADQIVVNECNSDKDSTYDELLKIQAEHSDKIEIVQSDWVDNWRQLSTLGNYCVPFLNTEWTWQLQADEVIHETSYPEIRRILQMAEQDVTAFKVHYTHLVANYETVFDFMYRELVRIARKGAGWWLTGDACHLEGGTAAGVRDSGIQVFHYGKVHSGRVAWQKEWDFQQLFKDIGFPDPKMQEMAGKFGEKYVDYLYLFEAAFQRGEFRRFTGTHPAVMSSRIKSAQLDGWEQFQSKMKQELQLKRT